MKKIALVSLGCSKNLVDSEVMVGYLEKSGYSFVPNIKEANIIIINTCGFIHPARNEARGAIQEAISQKKKSGKIKVIVTGCYVERNESELRQDFPEIDVWTGVNDFNKIVQIIEGRSFTRSKHCFLYDHTAPRRLSTPSSWAYIKISEGCSHRCSFCSIPLIKGPYQSRSLSSIEKEAKTLASRGVKEINIISHDSTYYGRDIGIKEGLAQLLKQLLTVKDIEWIRVLYSYPEEISEALLEIMQEKNVCSYLDIPFQHSASVVIKKMKRGLNGVKALNLLEKIRTKIPDMVFRTSLVVGFPGEGEKEYRNLINFVKEARFDHMGVFTYSREEGTDCFELQETVNELKKERRREEVMEIQKEISYQNNAKYVGQSIDVLIEGRVKQDPTLWIGRGVFQAPEVDGVVFIDTEKRDSSIENTIQKVEITARDEYDLYGY